MATENRAAKPRGWWRKYVIFLLGFGVGCVVAQGVIVILVLNAIFGERDYSVSARQLTNNPEVQANVQLSIERMLGAELPKSAQVTVWKETGWQELWMTVVFQMPEADASALVSRLDEIRAVLTEPELQDLQSFGKDGPMGPVRKPIRAWMLPKHSDMQTLVVRLAEVRDGNAIWIVEDLW